MNMAEFMFVDEVDVRDLESWNDTNYWRRKSIEEDTLQNALRDLEL